MNLEEVSKKATKRAVDRLKKIDNSNHPALKRLEEALKKIK